MAFSATALYLIASDGLHWRTLVASSLAGVATGASRYLFVGRPDPHIQGALQAQHDNEAEFNCFERTKSASAHGSVQF